MPHGDFAPIIPVNPFDIKVYQFVDPRTSAFLVKGTASTKMPVQRFRPSATRPPTPRGRARRPGGHSGVTNTRSHPELGREKPLRLWYCVSRRGRVGRRHVLPPAHTHPTHNTPTAGWSSPVARQAHNLKVGGSNPPPATKTTPVQPAHRHRIARKTATRPIKPAKLLAVFS